MIISRSLVRIPVAAAAAAGLALSMAACAQNAPDTSNELSPQFIRDKSEQFRSEGRLELAGMFEDGVIDASEYEQAFRAFSQCFIGRGHTVSDPVLNPADNLTYIYELDTTGLDPSVVTRDQNECSADFIEVEAMYAATTPQVMDEPLRLAIIECMNAQGLTIDANAKNYPEFITLAGDSADTEWRISFGSCLSQAGRQLYPDLESIPVGF